MINYLYYVKNEIICKSNETSILSNELDNYISIWSKYCNSSEKNFFHNDKYDLYNTHNFIFPTHESIQITWDIDKLYHKNILLQPKELSLSNLQNLIVQDIKNSIHNFLI